MSVIQKHITFKPFRKGFYIITKEIKDAIPDALASRVKLPLAVSDFVELIVSSAPTSIVILLHTAAISITGWFEGEDGIVMSVEEIGTEMLDQLPVLFHAVEVPPVHVAVPVVTSLLGLSVAVDVINFVSFPVLLKA